MDVFEYLEALGEANALFVDEVLRPRLEEALEELRGFRLLPLVVFILVERMVDCGIDAVVVFALGGREAGT